MNQSIENQERRYINIASFFAFFAVLGYTVLRAIDIINSGVTAKLVSHLVASAVVIAIMVVLVAKIKDRAKLGFYIPSIMITGVMASILLSGGSVYVFPLTMVICGMSGLYFSHKHLVRFFLLANILLFTIINILKFPIKGNDSPLSEVYFEWFLLFLVMLIFTIISKQSKSRQKKMLNAHDSFGTMLETTPNFILLLDEMNLTTYISKPLSALLSLERPEIAIGRPVMDLFYEPDMMMMVSDILDTTGFYNETREITIGEESHFYKIISDQMTGNTKGRFIDITDVTPIMKAKYDAEHAAKVKSDFLAKMSHEIRTPMNAIVGMSELILREDTAPTVYEYTLSIKQAGANLLSIINDILDFSKIESGKLEIIESEYLFSSLINDVISIIRMRVMDKNVLFVANIDCNIPNSLIGDELRIRQILLNLLSNATKYIDEGFVSLSVSGEISGDDTVVLTIEISDTGYGIKQEDLENLFADFAQIDKLKNKGIEGTGLGLAITKSLCVAMGGDIEVFSVYGEGSTFTITLPQRFTAYKMFAEVDNPDKKSVLIYEARTVYANSIICSIDNLGVSCTLSENQSEFYEEMSHTFYPYVFVPSFMYEQAKGMINRINPDSKLVLLAEYGEVVADQNMRTIAMPAHSISIANVLNDVTDLELYDEKADTAARFIAPSARILIVDDIATNLKVAEGLMASYQMKIDVCLSGIEAIALVKVNRYDIVFMDHMMPEMDGIEATAAIRDFQDESGYYQELPIIALTANAVSGVKEMFMQNGMNDFLSKPIEISKLNSILDKWIPKGKKEKYVARHTADEQPSFEIEGVDVKIGISMTGGTIDNYVKTLEIFHNDGISKLAEIENCLKDRNISLYTTHVHALKSACASIGAMDLSLLAKSLEAAGRDENIAAIDKNNGEFLEKLGVLLENINYVLTAGNNVSDVSEMDLQSVEEEFEKLRKGLESMDSLAVDEAIGALVKMPLNARLREIVDGISQNVLLSEYDEALELTDRYMDEL